MSGKTNLGKIGEDLACTFLEKKGYQILARNYRKSWGEIDIVGRAPDGTLVFFEVKTLRGSGDALQPEDNVTATKLKKLRGVCASFARGNPRVIREKRGWRIDVLAIRVSANEVDIGEENCAITHYENV